MALARELHDEGRLHEVFEKLGRRAPEAVRSPAGDRVGGDETRISTGEVARRLLRADYAVLHALERKGAYRLHGARTHRRAGRLGVPASELTAPQREALGSLRGAVRPKKPAALLHGVTGSGKTEIYIHLIAETLARGGDVLLVPEIALTAQLIGRMERIFGSRVTPIIRNLRTAAARRPTCG